MSTPEGLDSSIRSREIVFEADVTSVTPFLKLATVHRKGPGTMTFVSDEGRAQVARAQGPHRSRT